MNWQPIETAPKDGGTMILWEPSLNDKVTTGYWYKNILSWRDGDWWIEGGQITGQPTHWMPFPEPPI